MAEVSCLDSSLEHAMTLMTRSPIVLMSMLLGVAALFAQTRPTHQMAVPRDEPTVTLFSTGDLIRDGKATEFIIRVRSEQIPLSVVCSLSAALVRLPDIDEEPNRVVVRPNTKIDWVLSIVAVPDKPPLMLDQSGQRESGRASLAPGDAAMIHVELTDKHLPGSALTVFAELVSPDGQIVVRSNELRFRRDDQ